MNNFLYNLVKYNHMLNIKHMPIVRSNSILEHQTNCAITNSALYDIFIDRDDDDFEACAYESNKNKTLDEIITNKGNKLINTLYEATYINIVVHTNICSHVFALVNYNESIYLLDSFMNCYKLRCVEYKSMDSIINFLEKIIEGKTEYYSGIFDNMNQNSHLICIDFELFYDEIIESKINGRINDMVKNKPRRRKRRG